MIEHMAEQNHSPHIWEAKQAIKQKQYKSQEKDSHNSLQGHDLNDLKTSH
jgi:hypothetical protein